jgi:septal ring factor EnvC (AmiA/AmiB activator)
MRRIATLCLLLIALSPCAGAQTVPVPASKEEILNQPTADLRARQERQRALHDNLSAVDDEIDTLRATMIKVARDVRARETEINTLEDRIDDLQRQRAASKKKLQDDYGDIGGLATALMRLRNVPPEALMARPGAPIETAEAAMVLRNIVGPLQKNATSLAHDLDKLAKLEKDLTGRRTALKQASSRILKEQTKLADLVRRRESAYRNLRSDLALQEQELSALAKDAADFKDLLGKLERRNRELAGPETGGGITMASLPQKSKTNDRLLKNLGDIQLPISGVIRVGFGARDDIGSPSQGWRIEGRTGALVVTPMNGIVRYKGFFKNYGNMIIIEHAKNYHSLVAGLGKIDTVVGQTVEAGEPLGTLGTPQATRPAMYYELRQNGKPINPSRLFADLG